MNRKSLFDKKDNLWKNGLGGRKKVNLIINLIKWRGWIKYEMWSDGNQKSNQTK